MMVGTRPEGQEVPQAPGEVVAAVRVNGLAQAQDDPEVHGDEMQVARQAHPGDGRAHDADAEEESLDRGGVLGRQAEGGAVRVVELVDGAVEGPVVQHPVEPVVPRVLDHEEDADDHGHLPQGREGHAVVHAEVHGRRVEEPDLGELDGEVAEEDKGGAFPLFLPCWYFLLLRLLVKVSRVQIGGLLSVSMQVGNLCSAVCGVAGDVRFGSCIC